MTEADHTEDLIEVASDYRPLPRSARRELQDSGIITERSPDGAGPYTIVELESVPSDDVLDRYELRVIEDPDEVWKIDYGEVVEIYADRVEIDGREISMGVGEAKEKVRNQPQFQQVN